MRDLKQCYPLMLERVMKEPLPPLKWEVEPFFTQGDRVLVYGRSGAMKSWLLLHLGLHLAAGQPWLGKFNIPQPRKVLYIDEEMGEYRLRRRLKRLGEGVGFGLEELQLGTLARLGLKGDEKGPQELLKAFESWQWRPDIIIIEALRRVLGGSENNAEDVAAFWRNIGPITEAGITLIVSHHMRKGVPQLRRGANTSRMGGSFDAVSGSGDLLAGVDAALAIHREYTKDAVVIEPTKTRDAAEADAFIVSFIDAGKDSPVEMRFECARPYGREEGGQPGSETRTKVEQACELEQFPVGCGTVKE
jgi:RecA-family ATPase